MSLLLVAALSFLVEPRLYPETLTGRVGMVEGQPRMELAGGWSVGLTGELAGGVAAFPGAAVTVRGATTAEGFEVRALAPGHSRDLFTGRVTISCLQGSCAPYLVVGGTALKVTGKVDPKLLSALDGATVTMRGTETLGGLEAASGFLLVQGNLQTLAYPGAAGSEPHVGNQILYWGDRSIVVDSGTSAGAINGQNVWIGGRLEPSPSGSPQLTAVLVSEPIAGPPLGGFAGGPRSGGGVSR